MAQVNLAQNIGLDAATTGGSTGLIHEPTAAAFNDELYYTGNWFAGHSSDGGTTWAHVDPYTALPSAAGGFCCDQVTLHERNRNLWLWVLQYSKAGGTNVFRLAASTSGRPAGWFYWDFSPAALNPAWANLWFDYPDAATTNDHLYITYNMFDNTAPKNRLIQSLVFKLPLDGIVNRNLQYEYYVINTHGSLRLTRGATSDMFFGSHQTINPLRVFQWPDAAGSRLSYFDVTGANWSATDPYTSQAPDGANWLGRIDSRTTGAWVVGSQAGFLWTANSSAGRPQPYVKALVVDTGTQAIVSQPDIWDNNVAWAYPAVCPNVNGVVGLSLFYGGGGNYPTHAVGVMDAGAWVLAGTVASTNGPTDSTWGDYLSCETVDPNGDEWVASGYSLQGGNTRQFIRPQYVRFGVTP